MADGDIDISVLSPVSLSEPLSKEMFGKSERGRGGMIQMFPACMIPDADEEDLCRKEKTQQYVCKNTSPVILIVAHRSE